MESKKRFSVEIINVRWNCGSGCCSDSGYEVEITDNETNKFYNPVDDWGDCYFEENAISLFEDFMLKEFGITEDQIEIFCDIEKRTENV